MTVKYIISGLLVSALTFAGIFCVTFSTVTQSVPLILLSIATIMVVVFCKKSVSSSNLGLKILVITTCLYFLIRAHLSPVVDLARQDMFLIASATLIYSIMGILMPSKIIRTWLLRGFIVVMIMNLLNWIPAIDEWRDSTLGFAKGDRNTGLFNHRNFYGNFMCMMTCLCLSFAIFMKGKNKIRIGCLVLAVLGGISVILSVSRASFLSLVVGVVAIAACWMLVNFHSKDKSNKMLNLILSVGLSLIVMAILFIGGKHVLNERSTDMGDSNGRAAYFALSIEQIPDAPLIGSGSRSVEYKSYEYWPMSMSRNLMDFKFVHNEYIQAITDYGLVGFMLLLLVLFWHIVNGILLLFHLLEKNETKNIIYIVAGLSILASLSINMLFSFPLHGFVNLTLIVFAATMLLGDPGGYNSDKSSGAGSKLLFAVTVISLVITISYNFIEGRKELMAGSCFWKENIIVDDLNWNVEDSAKADWEKALTCAVAHSPTFQRYDRLGEILYSEGHLTEAFAYYELSKKRHPYSAVSRISLARLYTDNGDFKKAEEEYSQVEYLVKNREPLFKYYRNLAEFYLVWSSATPNLRAINLMKARKACEMSEKQSGYIHQGLRKTIARVLLASYYDLMDREQYEEGYKIFDRYVINCRGLVIKNDADAELMRSYIKELLKHAQFTWSRGLLERAAKATYRAKVFHHTYYGAKNREVDKSWADEDKKIDEALSIFMQAGVKIDKK